MTTPDAEDILCEHINASSLKTAINGIVSKRRPIGSKKEDIVVKALTINNLQMQTCVANVNIYVPNLVLKIGGAIDTKQPNNVRISELADIAFDVLNDKWDVAGEYNFTIQQQLVFEDEESDSHYINFRVEFNSINILN